MNFASVILEEQKDSKSVPALMKKGRVGREAADEVLRGSLHCVSWLLDMY